MSPVAPVSLVLILPWKSAIVSWDSWTLNELPKCIVNLFGFKKTRVENVVISRQHAFFVIVSLWIPHVLSTFWLVFNVACSKLFSTGLQGKSAFLVIHIVWFHIHVTLLCDLMSYIHNKFLLCVAFIFCVVIGGIMQGHVQWSGMNLAVAVW